jgi:glycosyltransferase involved in cell wall biosynthesis|tara:strand:+ start:690 stop:2105 length:1416 start_codon:yes stop_codon:yes gene_type:complete
VPDESPFWGFAPRLILLILILRCDSTPPDRTVSRLPAAGVSPGAALFPAFMRSLLVTSVLPDDRYSGSSKRCAVHLRALAELGRVDIFCLRPFIQERVVPDELAPLVGDVFYAETSANDLGWERFHKDTSRIRRVVAAFTRLAPKEVCRLDGAERTALSARFDDGRYDHVFGFKLTGISWARQVMRSGRPRITGDLDDISSELRDASRSRTAGPLTQALDKRHVRMMREAERGALRDLPLVMVCAEGDMETARAIAPAARGIAVIPNAVPIVPAIPPRAEASPIRILFVGILNYAPNSRGLRWFAEQALPLLSERLQADFQIDVVGRGDNGRVAGICAPHAQMNFIGEVDSIEGAYKEADLVIVPLLEGSGTRLKILEAFTLGRAVVSTTKGAEGLGTTDGENLLIGDTPAAFADAIARAATDAPLRARLVAAGRKLVTENFSAEATIPREAALFRQALHVTDKSGDTATI